ncbi:MAG TPA: hypothetical protein VHS31_16250, partial [Tepidisphaeraceae bacterium]|nr:hypothetical protein [Tepidisphaeraceae bacterium]
MKSSLKLLSRTVLGACLLTGMVSPIIWAADPPATPAAKPAAGHEAADQPNPKHDKTNPEKPEAGFVKRHEGFLKDLAKLNGKCGVLFVGDSITDGWRGGGKEVFAKNYGAMDP